MSVLTKKGMSIIVQGITGREAASFVKDCLQFGSNIVAGVTPGKGGTTVHGVPVYDCIRQIPTQRPIDCAVISVPPLFVKDAAVEAIDNDIKLLVIVTERVPLKDVVQVLATADLKDARVIGPNSLGIISPEETKIGMMGGPVEDIRKSYSKGTIGILSRSGGMSTEIANLLTINGFGQSTVISMGGDPIVGSNFVDLIPLFCQDPETKAVVIYSEPGGSMEISLAEYIRENPIDLPVVAFISGRFVDQIPDVRFGHAGAIVEKGKGTTKEKIEQLKSSGIRVADLFSDIPKLLSEALIC